MGRARNLSAQDVDRLLNALRIVSRTVDHVVETRAVDQAAREPLSPSKLQILRLLGQQDSQNASEVARFLGVSKPAVTQIIHSMIDAKLVTRTTSREDRREVGLKLTPRGRQQYQNIAQRQRQVLRNAARRAGAPDMHQWTEVLWNIARGLIEADGELEQFCVQCDGLADRNCVLAGGDAKCLILLEDVSGRPRRRTPASRRPYRGVLRERGSVASASNGRRRPA